MRHRIRWESKPGKLFVNESEVDIAESQAVVNKSSDFSFGYGGSGPSQSALAILLRVTDRRTARRHFQGFKEAFTARVSADKDWEYFVDIDEWIAIPWADQLELTQPPLPATLIHNPQTNEELMLENLERATRKYRGPVWFVRLVIFKNGVKFLLKHRRFIQIGIEPGHRDRSTTSIHYGGLGPEDVETALVDFADHVGHENATLQQARDILE